MLTTGAMPEYLFRRLIEDGSEAISSGEEQLTPELLARTTIRLGNLADLDAEAGEIPEIPQDVRLPQPPSKNNNRKGRNTVFDDRGSRSAADG
jgi:hypothetical protein